MYNSLLRHIGAALYVCEGTKARRDFRTKEGLIYSIELTNSDPNIIQLFSRFLNEIIEADWKRVRGQLFIYPDLKEGTIKNYWAEISGIPEYQFQKSIYLKSKTSKFKPSPHGTFKIRYSCKKDFLKLNEIINDMWKETGVIL